MQGIVSDALKYVTQKTEQVNTLQKLDERAGRINGRGRSNRKKEEVYVLVTVRVYFNYGLRYSLL
jgi:hypothetical protein